MRKYTSSSIAASLSALLIAAAAASAGAADPSTGDVKVDPRLAAALQRDLGIPVDKAPNYLRSELSGITKEAQAKRLLGSGYAGGWVEYDKEGNARYIATTTGIMPKAANLNGIEVRQARFSMRQLEDALERFNAVHRNAADVRKLDGVHAWYVDVKSNSVVVKVAPGSMLSAIDFAAVSGADTRTLRFVESREAPRLLGVNVIGGRIYQSGSAGCSIGFAVTTKADGNKGFVTAGHCGPIGTTVKIGGVTVGEVKRKYFPGLDMAFARVRNDDILQGFVKRYSNTEPDINIAGNSEAPVGNLICRSGYKTGYRCGTVVAKNVTVNYSGQIVEGLTDSNACAGSGDSGGSWITPGGQAQGVTSGGNVGSSDNNCDLKPADRNTYFQRLNPILDRYELNLVK
jgi:hypothetical protein